MDAKIEGYLAAATVLIPTGIALLTSPITPDGYGNQIIGGFMVIAGLIAIGIRGNKKETRVKKYVTKKVSEVKP